MIRRDLNPRTKKKMEDFGLGVCRSGDGRLGNGLIMVQPLGYLEFLHLNMNARLILTDSGGLQEESTVLGVPCITLRDSTERPITCTEGTNRVIGNEPRKILESVREILCNELPSGTATQQNGLWMCCGV